MDECDGSLRIGGCTTSGCGPSAAVASARLAFVPVRFVRPGRDRVLVACGGASSAPPGEEVRFLILRSCRVWISVTTASAIVGMSSEIAACTLQLQSAKQESKHEEVKLAKLEEQVKSRRKMQEARLAGIQKVIAERSSLVEKQEERMRMREHVMARSKFDLGLH